MPEIKKENSSKTVRRWEKHQKEIVAAERKSEEEPLPSSQHSPSEFLVHWQLYVDEPGLDLRRLLHSAEAAENVEQIPKSTNLSLQ